MIRVFIIDESAKMRGMIADVLVRDPSIEVVGQASDAYEAWHKLKRTSVDVLTLDIELPRMDGLTFLAKIMHAKPLPVVMVTEMAKHDANLALRALQLGAVDLVDRPETHESGSMLSFADDLRDKIATASVANINTRRRRSSRNSRTTLPQRGERRGVIAMGASTGGTEALAHVLASLPSDAPGIVIVQHMPARFINSFARRLDAGCLVTVHEARDGAVVEAGSAVLAPGDSHTEIRRVGSEYVTSIRGGPRRNRFRPSVDVLFDSVANQAGDDAIGVLLTGMGRDGAAGMLAMHDAGVFTIAQDEATSVVFGMPKEAIRLNAVDLICPLDEVAFEIIQATGGVAASACRQ